MRLRPDRKPERVKEGEARNAAWAKLSAAQRLADLDQRLGKGRGATRQRRILTAAQ